MSHQSDIIGELLLSQDVSFNSIQFHTFIKFHIFFLPGSNFEFDRKSGKQRKCWNYHHTKHSIIVRIHTQRTPQQD